MNVAGITWHAIVLDPEPFAAAKALLTETFSIAPAVDPEGFVRFKLPNGTILELYAPQAVPADYGYNDGVAFGFRVDDVEAASAAVEAAGCELLGEITRMEQIAYSYRDSAVRTAASTASTSRSSAHTKRRARVLVMQRRDLPAVLVGRSPYVVVRAPILTV